MLFWIKQQVLPGGQLAINQSNRQRSYQNVLSMVSSFYLFFHLFAPTKRSDSYTQATWTVLEMGYSCLVRTDPPRQTARSHRPCKSLRTPTRGCWRQTHRFGPYSDREGKSACLQLLGAGVAGSCCPGTGVACGETHHRLHPAATLPHCKVQPKNEGAARFLNGKTKDTPTCRQG